MKKNNLKNERGVTITSVLIYIIALTAVVIIIGRISTYFYRNMDQVTTNTAAAAEYTKFNSYFTDEINIEGNEVEFWEPNLIIFSKSENQYTFQGNGIYRNKVKICKDVEACTFSYNEDTKKIDVYLKIYNREYNVTYTVAKEVTVPGGSGNGETTIADLKDKPANGNTTLTDDNGDNITIPDGFNVEKDSPTNVVEGIVIEDKVDNQYVWIPVFEKSASRDWGADYSSVTTAKTASNSEFTDTDFTNIETALKAYTSTYKTRGQSDVWYGDENYGQYGYYDGTEFKYYTNGNMTESEYNTLYHNMLVSVYKNGGFYIGRYEMGTGVATSTDTAQNLTRISMSEYTPSADENSSTTVRTDAEPSIDGMPTPVSKVDAVGYSYITQSQAQMLARKIGQENGYGTTTSSLMFGVQWNAVCVFIEKYDTNNTATTKSDWLGSNSYSKLWGNVSNSTFTMDRGYYSTTYSNNPVTWNAKAATAKGTSDIWLCTTGASEQNSSLNIYDFSGNLYEFTLERNTDHTYPCTLRGGGFNFHDYASRMTVHFVQGNNWISSGRPSLFL